MMLCRHKDVYEVYIVNKENAEIILEKMHKNYGKAGENPYIVLDNHYKYRYTNIFPLSCAYGYWDDNNTLNYGYYRYNNASQIQFFDNNQQKLLDKDIYGIQKEGNYFITGDYSFDNYSDGNHFCTPKEFQEEYELVFDTFDTFDNNKRKG